MLVQCCRRCADNARRKHPGYLARPKSDQNFIVNISAKFNEAEGRGGLPFAVYDYVNHLDSGQSLGFGSGLGSGLGSAAILEKNW